MAELHCRITPNAKQDEVLGWETDADGREVLRLKIKAPPVDGKANKHLVSLLSKLLGVPKSQIEIARGEKSRIKTLSLATLDNAEVRSRIEGVLDG